MLLSNHSAKYLVYQEKFFISKFGNTNRDLTRSLQSMMSFIKTFIYNILTIFVETHNSPICSTCQMHRPPTTFPERSGPLTYRSVRLKNYRQPKALSLGVGSIPMFSIKLRMSGDEPFSLNELEPVQLITMSKPEVCSIILSNIRIH